MSQFKEIPYTFQDRELGSSKLSMKTILTITNQFGNYIDMENQKEKQENLYRKISFTR